MNTRDPDTPAAHDLLFGGGGSSMSWSPIKYRSQTDHVRVPLLYPLPAEGVGVGVRIPTWRPQSTRDLRAAGTLSMDGGVGRMAGRGSLLSPPPLPTKFSGGKAAGHPPGSPSQPGHHTKLQVLQCGNHGPPQPSRRAQEVAPNGLCCDHYLCSNPSGAGDPAGGWLCRCLGR